MKVLIAAVFFLKLLFLGGCITSQTSMSVKKFDLSKVDSLKLGEQKAHEVLQILGPPIEKIELSKLPQAQNNGTVWQYDEDRHPRISIFFKSDIVQSVTWKVHDGDSEQDVNVVKRRYSKKWKIVIVPPGTPHTSPEICKLISQVDGVSIDIRASVKRVTVITRWNVEGIVSEKPVENWQSDLCDFLK